MSTLIIEQTSPRWTLLAVCTAAMILPLSFTGGVIATPAIAQELGGSPLALSWITNAFMLTFGSLLMAAGSLADHLGRKRLFLSGVGLFTLTSLIIGLAPNVLILDLLRALQGIAAACALAGGAAALADSWSGAAQARAFSLLGTSFGVGIAGGPVVAGLLIDHGGWRSVFLLPALLGGTAALISYWRMRESRASQRTVIDTGGIITFSLALTAFTWGILQFSEDGWRHPLVIALLACALLFSLLFMVIELKSRQPMLDLTLFRYRRFLGIQLLPIATCYCFVVLLALLPVRFMGIDGYSTLTTGLLMLPISAPILVVPSLAVTLTRWFSPATLASSGLVIAAGGLLLLSQLDSSTDLPLQLLAMLIIGCGSGLPWGLMDGLSVSVVPEERAGMATGIFSTIRVAGEGVALALVTSLLTVLIAAPLTALLPEESARHAAQYLAAGYLTVVAHSLQLPVAALQQIWLQAFNQLLLLLMAITLLCALLVQISLRHKVSQ
ncbi:MFS family permease [Erwinia toletana]|uniref:MFS family permease n=1 Tax=Winslowiella toletana TaxID=92490 RepID=A0ABS4PEQ3_9GAMM|nr:MFS transporter [Winslowiella toletana]MBP2171119.1 MFS family permease [Winslowiella toletana]